MSFFQNMAPYQQFRTNVKSPASNIQLSERSFVCKTREKIFPCKYLDLNISKYTCKMFRKQSRDNIDFVDFQVNFI